MSDFDAVVRVSDDFVTDVLSRDSYHYYVWILTSFVICLFIHHALSPFIFRRHNKAYREFSREKRMEWDSRLVSSIHATVVSVLCVSTLLRDTRIWSQPLTYPSACGLIALSISVGYFLCDMVSMPLYWGGSQLYIFLLHHLAAALAFQQVVHYQVCVFFGVYRLTTEMSTPFINQRWFYRTIGYKPDRRRVCTVTLMFAILFAVTRNFMIIPFWCIAYQSFTSTTYATARQAIPWLDVAFAVPPFILDCLNVYWASKTYRIGWRAAKTLWYADWKSDIRLAHARLRRRLRRIRRRTQSETASDQQPALTHANEIYLMHPDVFHSLTTSSSSSLSSSNCSTETEYEAADSEMPHPTIERDEAGCSAIPPAVHTAQLREAEQVIVHRVR